jgi:outer membrane lipoprotein carrier protein
MINKLISPSFKKFKNSMLSTAVVFSISALVPVYAQLDNDATTVKTAQAVQVPVLSPAKKILIDKLNQIQFFQAKFTQQVIDNDGNVIQEGSGILAISKPNLVHWQTLEPDENLIVSDGDNIWFYDPWVDQVTAYLFKNSVANTPILLLTNDDLSLWADYKVSQINNETFAIVSLNSNSQIKTLELTFNKTADQQEQLAQITFLDATGQLSKISLVDADYKNAPNASLFQFTLPEGVTVDDQR